MHYHRAFIAGLGLAVLATITWQQRHATHASGLNIDESRLIDLTYPLDEASIYWPTAKPFHYERDASGPTLRNYWYSSGNFSGSERVGTHIESPRQFAEGKAPVDQIVLGRLMVPAVQIDVSAACAKDRDYQLRVEDILAWEGAHGHVPDGIVVLVHTGWGRYWPDKKKYLGSATPDDVMSLHFPGISQNAAEFLAGERKIYGVGIDTASLDPGVSKNFMAHRVLNDARIYGLENVANLDKVPATGATLIVLPLKIRGGAGGPARIVALLP